MLQSWPGQNKYILQQNESRLEFADLSWTQTIEQILAI